MMSRSRYIVIAVLFGIGLAGCGGGSQSAVDPSASGQTIQGPMRTSSIHKATVQFTWTHSKVDVPAGKLLFVTTACQKTGATVINGTYEKNDIGDDITVIDSFPVTNYSWQITAKNTGDHEESYVYYLLCATDS